MLFIRFDIIHECDRQTDGQTDRLTDRQMQTSCDGLVRTYAEHRAVKIVCWL